MYDTLKNGEKSPSKIRGVVQPYQSRLVTELKRALQTEKLCLVTLKEQVAQLRKIRMEEQGYRDELRATCTIQRKKIETLGLKHIRETGALEHGLASMNEVVSGNADEALKQVK